MSAAGPGFPDQFMPFSDAPRAGRLAAHAARFTYGPLISRLRKRAIRGR